MKFIKITDGVFGYVSLRQSFYAIVDFDGKVILIDAGYKGNAQKNFIKFLTLINKKIYDIKAILVTHADGDHIGGIEYLLEKNSLIKIYASNRTSYYLKNRLNCKHYGILNPLISLLNRIFISKIEVDFIINEGDILDFYGGIQVIDSKGHTDDHICFYLQNKKILFAGDLMFLKNNNLQPSHRPVAYDYELEINNFNKISTINFSYVCCGHADGVYYANKSD